MIGIIGAMQIEIQHLKDSMQNIETVNVSGVDYFLGSINGKKVVAAVCGIGKVFASICAEAMILKFNPSVVINIGVGGTLSNKLNTADIAIAQSVVHHDLDTSPLGDPIGLISGINIINIDCDKNVVEILKKSVDEIGINNEVGVIASGDQFVCTTERKNFIKDNFNAIACEMEGASIGHVCYVNNVKFGVLRAISDGADEKSHMQYEEFVPVAAKNSYDVIMNFIENYNE